MFGVSNSRCSDLWLFRGRGGYDFAFYRFEGFNEEMIGREAEMRGSMVKCGKGQL